MKRKREEKREDGEGSEGTARWNVKFKGVAENARDWRRTLVKVERVGNKRRTKLRASSWLSRRPEVMGKLSFAPAARSKREEEGMR